MEKGEIRFHGPTSELLERPDVLRSVFLEGAASVELDVDGPAIVHVSERAGDRGRSPTAAPSRATARTATRGSALDGISKHFGGISALTDVSFDVADGEVLGFLGPNGAGKTTLFDVLSRLPAERAGRRAPRRCARSASLGPDARARRGLGRSFQDGRLFPALTVSRDDRGRARAQHRRARPDRGRAAPARRSPTPKRRCAHASRSSSSCSASARSATSTCASSRPGAGASSTSRACSRTDRAVLLLDEPSSGIAQREAEALGPLLLRIRADDRREPAHHRARRPVAHVDRGPHDRARPRRDRRGRARRTRSSAIPASLRRTWESPKQSLLAAVPAVEQSS